MQSGDKAGEGGLHSLQSQQFFAVLFKQIFHLKSSKAKIRLKKSREREPHRNIRWPWCMWCYKWMRNQGSYKTQESPTYAVFTTADPTTYCGFWLVYMQVGNFCVSMGPLKVSLTLILCNAVFFKSQNSRMTGTLCTTNCFPSLFSYYLWWHFFLQKLAG